MFQLVRQNRDGKIEAKVCPTKGKLIMEVFEALGAGDLFLVDPDPSTVFDAGMCEAMRRRLEVRRS